MCMGLVRRMGTVHACVTFLREPLKLVNETSMLAAFLHVERIPHSMM
jgi:hypothetical protein